MKKLLVLLIPVIYLLYIFALYPVYSEHRSGEQAREAVHLALKTMLAKLLNEPPGTGWARGSLSST